MSPELIALLSNTVLPAVAAFVIGHLQLLNLPFLKKPVPPAVPAVPPVVPAVPTIRPIGQGGLIDLFGQLISQILASTTLTPEAKAAAVSQVSAASASVITK